MNRETISKVIQSLCEAKLLRTNSALEDWQVGNTFIRIGNNGCGFRNIQKITYILHIFYSPNLINIRIL